MSGSYILIKFAIRVVLAYLQLIYQYVLISVHCGLLLLYYGTVVWGKSTKKYAKGISALQT
jgi:hypothetical protein